MGLAEKRAVEAIKTGVFKDITNQVAQVVGKEVQIDVAWDDFMKEIEGRPDALSEYVTSVFFSPLVNGLKAVCADDMSRKAVNEGVNKIELACSGSYWSEGGISFSSGTLKLDSTYANIEKVQARTDAVQKVIENGL